MASTDDPLRDPARVAAVRQADLLDSEPEEIFDQLTRLAARMMDAPIAMVSVLDDRRHFSKSSVGLEGVLGDDRNLPLEASVCSHVVQQGAPLVVSDAREHPQLRDNLSVRDLGVVAYLGVPLMNPDGHALGALCVVDAKPRPWKPEEVDHLRALAGTVMSTIALRGAARHAAQEGGAPAGDRNVTSATHVLDELRRCVVAHVGALDRYDDIVRGAVDTADHLERERAGQRAVTDTLAALEQALARHEAGLESAPGEEAVRAARLLAAARSYVAAERAREAASSAFVERRMSLEDYQIACAAARSPEQALRQELMGA